MLVRLYIVSLASLYEVYDVVHLECLLECHHRAHDVLQSFCGFYPLLRVLAVVAVVTVVVGVILAEILQQHLAATDG